MNRARTVRRGLAALAALLLLSTAATLVLAAETSLLDGKLRVGDTVTLPAAETVDGDLYLFAGTVQADGSVDGDLTAFGGTVHVNGTVSGDLLVAGGTVNVAGDVEGDVRSSGGQVTISGAIGEDLLVTGGQVTLAGGSSVGGDLMTSGGDVSVSGAVEGSIEGSAGTYNRSGTVGGTENVRVSTDADGEDAAAAAGDRVVDGLRHFVVLVIIGALLLLVLPRIIRRPADTLQARPLLSLGGGFLAWIGLIVFAIVLILVAVLLAIVLGLVQLGALAAVEIVAAILTLGVVTFIFWMAVAFLADLVVGFTLARLVVRGDQAGASPWVDLALLAGGAAVVVVLTSLPIVGGIAKLIVMLFGLGALAVWAWRSWRGRGRAEHAAPPPTESPATI